MSAKNVDSNNNSSDKLKIVLNLPPSATKSPQDDERWNGKKVRTFLFCFGGLQLSFLLWGLLQERIIKFSYASTLDLDLNGSHVVADHHKLNIAYKEDLQKFKSSQFLVLTNRLAGLILSSIILLVCNRNSSSFAANPSWRKIISDKNWAPLFVCSYSSMSNVLSSWFQYESLKYVTFTTQLLAKSSKSVFVMLTIRVTRRTNISRCVS